MRKRTINHDCASEAAKRLARLGGTEPELLDISRRRDDDKNGRDRQPDDDVSDSGIE